MAVVPASSRCSLHIHHGCPNGCHLLDELATADGEWKSERAKGTLGVTHPEHGTPRAGTRQKKHPAE